MRCFLSAGHGPSQSGGYDPGACEPLLGYEEHKIARQIVTACAHAMRLVQPVLVPDDGLPGKIRFVNRWSEAGDIAVEVHLNWASSPAARGVEAFYASGSGRGRHLAEAIHDALAKAGRSPRGAKPDTQARHRRLGWVRDTKPWAALVEVCFLSNPEERAWIQSPKGLADSARAIASSISEWE